jgi:hypothetical protein
VDGKGCVKVRTNFYSTPLRAGTRAQAKLLPAYVEVWQERECVARHERSFGRYEQVLDLEHYLDVLEKKPGALAGSSPLRQWRVRGRWPESFDRLWQSLQERHGKHSGTREMIELLTLGKRYGWDRLQQVIEQSLALGCTDAARSSAPADGNRTESSAYRVARTEWAGALRAAVAADQRVRPVTQHLCQHGGGGAMKEQTQALEHASVKQYCKDLRVPMIGAHFVQLAEQAIKEQRSHIGYLEALLTMESEERDRHAIQQRLRDAKLPRVKTLEEFDFNQARQIPAAKIRELAEGGYIERVEPVVLMGECGTGKTHLATGLCVAACRQKRRARFTTAANLVNELVETVRGPVERSQFLRLASIFLGVTVLVMRTVFSSVASNSATNLINAIQSSHVPVRACARTGYHLVSCVQAGVATLSREEQTLGLDCRIL